MNKVNLALSVLAIGIASSFAQGSELSDTGQEHTINPVPKVSGFYIGGTIGTGRFYIHRDSGKYTDKTYYSGQSTLAKNDASSGAQSLQLLAGYQFNRIVAVEMDYTHYINSLNFREFVSDPAATLSGQYQTEQIHAKPRVYIMQANVGYTFANGIRPFALVGLGFLYLNADKDVYYADTFSDMLVQRFGTGVEYAPVILQGWALRASWIADVTLITKTSKHSIIENIHTPNSRGDDNDDNDDNDDQSNFNRSGLSNFNLGVSYKF
jgi:hypothetical protein